MSTCAEKAEAMEMNSVVLENTTAFAVGSATNGREFQPKADDHTSNTTSPPWSGTDVRGKIKASLRRIPVKKWQKFETSVLGVLIVVVWGLALLPVVFYFYPTTTTTTTTTSEEKDTGTVSASGSGLSSELSSGMGSGLDGNYTCVVTYVGVYCRDVLKSLQMCIPGHMNTTEIFISNHLDDQSTQEMEIGNLLFALDLAINPSEECRKKVVPFLCLYTFGLCGENNDDYKPTATECVNIKDVVCRSEWRKANDLLSTRGQSLPDCNSFDADGLSCSVTQLEESPCTTECHEQFYCENNFCKPRCDRFEEFSHSYVVASDVVVAMCACICVLSGLLVLVISCLRYKRILTFPTVLIVYQTLTLLVFGVTALVSFMDRSGLYCSSIDLVQSIESPTGFCKLSGAVFYYVLIQISLWWGFHVCALFWKVQFPLHSRSFEKAHRIKYIHLMCVILALVLPLVPVITAASKGGFTITRFPTLLCAGRDADATFYTLVLPIVVMLGIGTTVLVLIFWKIHKQHGLFRAKMQKTPMKIGTAERKILLVFLYYISLGAVALTAFTLATKHLSQNITATLQYFDCEKLGGNSSTCDLDIKQFPSVTLAAYVLLGLFPAINLVFAVNIKELKSIFRKLRSKVLGKTLVSISEERSESTTVSRK